MYKILKMAALALILTGSIGAAAHAAAPLTNGEGQQLYHEPPIGAR
jgi:hypothetical protein